MQKAITLGEAFRRKGQEEGRQEGRLEALKAVAITMIRSGRQLSEVCAFTSLPKHEVQALRADIG